MKGHIRLGTTVADLREYVLTDPNGLSKQLANQMAAKLGQGAGKYDDLQDWSAWVMDNWSAGAGTVDPDGGGFLFGTVDSRVPRQLLLPPALGLARDVAFSVKKQCLPPDLTSYAVTEQTLSAGTQQVWTINAKHNWSVSHDLWVYANIPDGATITVKLYDSTNITLLDTLTFTAEAFVPDHQWHRLSTNYSVVSGTDYVVRMSVNATWTVFTPDQYSNTNPFFIFQILANGITKFVRFNNVLYGGNQVGLYKFSGGVWTYMAGSPTLIYQLVVFNGKLYIGRASGGLNFYTMSTGEAFTDGGAVGYDFCKWNGYLYRTVAANLYYTADGTTWTGPFTAEPGQTINGMAGMGNDLYFADRNALYRLAPGDTVFGVLQWGKYAGTIGNGYTYSGMCNWQGDIYIAVDGQIMRYTQNGQASEIWLRDQGDLPYPLVGQVTSLSVMNNYLVASVASLQPTVTQNSVWAWTKQGWHCLTLAPQSQYADYGITSTYYDRTNNRLWIGGFYLPLYLTISDLTRSPFTAAKGTDTGLFMPSGWIETHWFDGNLIEIRKDFESVYCTGENSSTGGVNAVVYWKDDESTGWETLGTFDSLREEISWSDAATRPNSRQLKIAIRLYANSVSDTPKLEAIRVKYMSMLLDRYRWSMPISLSANQEMLDGTLNSYTLAQQEAHVESLIESVAPIYFEDVNGVQYKVKVLGASRSIRDFEYRNPSTAKVYKLVYNIVIEQTLSNINV